jgi:RsiW-degrading membrane proteinase PrsW (M82 family)
VSVDAAVYHYDDPKLGLLGPYSANELRLRLMQGAIHLDTPLYETGSPGTIPFRLAWFRHWPDEAPPRLPVGEFLGGELAAAGRARSKAPGFTGQTREDLRVLAPHLALPLDELRSFQWLRDRRALAIAAIGLLPLVIFAVFRGPDQLINAYWAMALYFSALWALFFYFVFPTPEVRVRTAALAFFVTGVASVSVLLVLYAVWPLNRVNEWIHAEYVLVRWLGYVLAVGVPEELCKAFVLLVLVRRFGPVRPHTLLFYGLMSGLGFGIYEGLKYQTRENFQFAIRASGQADAYFAAEYYLLNLIRLTTLPFLHAIWTGMAGYFIGFAEQYPERQRGLLVVAIGLPALLHGTYNTFGGALGMGIALLSVLALNLYLAKSVEFEKLLRRDPVSGPFPPSAPPPL